MESIIIKELPPAPLFVAETNNERKLWEEVVREGEERAKLTLEPLVREHLVTVLTDFLRVHDFISLAESVEQWFMDVNTVPTPPSLQVMNLFERIGDSSLLVNGLFPEKLRTSRAHPLRFQRIATHAFRMLAKCYAEGHEAGKAHEAREIARAIEPLTETLRATRHKDYSYLRELFLLEKRRRYSLHLQ